MKNHPIYVSFLAIFFATFPIMELQAIENRTISIQMDELVGVSYYNDSLVLKFNKKLWHKIRTFTSNNIGEQIQFILDNEVIAKPHVISPSDSGAQILLNEEKANTIIKKFNNGTSKTTVYPDNERVEFLEEWLLHNPRDYRALSGIIQIYHKTESNLDCQKAIQFFDSFSNKETKEKTLKQSIFQLIDCYIDLNLPQKGLVLLQSSLDKIDIRDQWIAYENIAYLYEMQKKYAMATNYYNKTLMALDSVEILYVKEYAAMNLGGVDKILTLVHHNKNRIKQKLSTIQQGKSKLTS